MVYHVLSTHIIIPLHNLNIFIFTPENTTSQTFHLDHTFHLFHYFHTIHILHFHTIFSHTFSLFLWHAHIEKRPTHRCSFSTRANLTTSCFALPRSLPFITPHVVLRYSFPYIRKIKQALQINLHACFTLLIVCAQFVAQAPNGFNQISFLSHFTS